MIQNIVGIILFCIFHRLVSKATDKILDTTVKLVVSSTVTVASKTARALVCGTSRLLKSSPKQCGDITTTKEFKDDKESKDDQECKDKEIKDDKKE